MDEAYPNMLDDPLRMRRHREALHATVRPGDVVVDIGCATGGCTVFAAEAGARQVWGIEMDRIVDVAREVAARSPHADRIGFFEQFSTDVELPEPADVVFFEDFTSFLVHDDLEKIILDARNRLLKPGGRLMPLRGRVWAAPFHDRRFRSMVDPWGLGIHYLHGLDYYPVREMQLNTLTWNYSTRDHLLAEPQLLREITFRTETDFQIHNDLIFRCNRRAEVHGLLVWFDVELAPGVVIDNAPGLGRTVWDQGALPFERVLEVEAGEPLEVSLRTVESAAYGHHWTWTVRQEGPAGGLPILLRQNSFRSDPLPKSLAHALAFAG